MHKAQLLRLSILQKTMGRLARFSVSHTRQVTEALRDQLAEESDRFLLPYFALFFHENYPDSRKPRSDYRKFFIENGEGVRLFRSRYKKVIHAVEKRNLEIIAHLCKATVKRESVFGGTFSVKLGVADFHNRSSQVLIIRNNKRATSVWKPRSAQNDIFVGRFLDTVSPDWRDRILLPKVHYSSERWSEVGYVRHSYCSSVQDVKRYFHNFGYLLAILDSLNYTDGHFENIIAHGNKVAPIDLETILSAPRSNKNSFRNNIYDTGLITPESSLSALKNYDRKHLYPVDTFPINDGSVLMEVRYRKFTDKGTSKNMPTTGKTNDFQQSGPILDGYFMALSDINLKQAQLTALVDQYSSMYVRRIVRPTLFYSWLMIRNFHPVNSSRTTMDSFLRDNLSDVPESVQEREIWELNRFNIPIFYGRIDSRDLYDQSNRVIAKDFFSMTARDYFLHKIAEMKSNAFFRERKKQITKALR